MGTWTIDGGQGVNDHAVFVTKNGNDNKILIDENIKSMKWSKLFKFEDNLIDYTTGLIVEDERIIITYSTILITILFLYCIHIF